MNIESVIAEIKTLLKDITQVSDNTQRNDGTRVEIDFFENPLNPNLMAYCFDVILGFDVRYRIAEKVNYIIDFSYKGTYATVRHFKMSYCLFVEGQFKEEIISLLKTVHVKLEQLFMLIGEQALITNAFSMKNEAPEYFSKLKFYRQKIKKLEARYQTVSDKCRGKHEIIEDTGKYKSMKPKGQPYLHELHKEIIYDIESYIDTFFSALEHILTLLYPFVCGKSLTKSYYKDYIRNTKWTWDAKIRDICGNNMPGDITSELRRIKEVYRNHNAHGGFSREMMAYVQIPDFGRYPMYIGKEYLKGFMDGESDSISYEMYIHARDVFQNFWDVLDASFEIPMMFIRSGLAIPLDTDRYTNGIESVEAAQWCIDKMWYDLDNQSNMDW